MKKVEYSTATACLCCNSQDLKRSPAILSPFLAKKIYNWDVVEIDSSWQLRDIKEGYAYPLCSSLQCRLCDFLFLDIRFTDAEMSRYYEDYQSEDFFKERELLEPSFKERRKNMVPGSGDIADVFSQLNEVEKFISNCVEKRESVLDWGGKDGLNTPFKDSCRVHHILDFNKRQLSKAKVVSFTKAKKSTYDLVVFRHVLEHCSYPAEILEQVKDCLSLKSAIYIELPFEEIMHQNVGSKDLYKRKKLWHEHINFFSEKSIVSLLKRCGYQILDSSVMNIKDSSIGGTDGRYHLMYIASLAN